MVTAHCANSQNRSKPSSRQVRRYCNRRRTTGCLFLMEQDKLRQRQGDSSRLVCLSVHCVSESFLAIWFLCDKKADSTSHTDNWDANSQRADIHLMASAAKKLSINTTKVGVGIMHVLRIFNTWNHCNKSKGWKEIIWSGTRNTHTEYLWKEQVIMLF